MIYRGPTIFNFTDSVRHIIRIPFIIMSDEEYEYDYGSDNDYNYGSDNDADAAGDDVVDELIEIENSFYGILIC